MEQVRPPARALAAGEQAPRLHARQARREATEMPSGHCCCTAVSYTIDGPLCDVVNCHCDRCRRITGHFLAATAAAVADITITDPDANLTWYEPTADVGYGFCRTCGSTLFWRSARTR
jgi:hypothetical protein